MPTFTVHERSDQAMCFERTAFVRDGFHVWAFVFGPLWLLWHRLWLALIASLVVLAAVGLALSALGVSSGARFAVSVAIALLIGLEAATIRRWTLSRGRWRQVDLIVADDRETAEVSFFGRRDEASAWREPARDSGSVPSLRSAAPDIIGSFPQPGAMR